MNAKDKLKGTGNLALQINDAVCKRYAVAPIDQSETVAYCREPEEVFEAFFTALEPYPPSVLRLPMAVVLVEVANIYELMERTSKRKVKKILKAITPAIRHAVREADVVVRYGRNRFAILLLGADEEMAGKVCQRLKEAVNRICYLKLGLPSQPALEFAIAEHIPGSQMDLAELVLGSGRTIRLARSLGGGVILKNSELKSGFRQHVISQFHIGEPCTPSYILTDVD